MIFLIKIILVITIFSIGEVTCDVEPALANELRSNILEPISSFAAYMRMFFHSVATDINKKRIKYKNILHTLVKDIQSDKILINSVTSTTTTRIKPNTADKHNVKRYLTDHMKVSTYEEGPLQESKIEYNASEPTLEDFLQYIEKNSAYDKDYIACKDIKNSKSILTVSKPCNASEAIATQVVQPNVTPQLNTEKHLPRQRNDCRLIPIINSVIKMLQDGESASILINTSGKPSFKHFESNTILYDMTDLKKTKIYNKQEITKYAKHKIYECLEVIFQDVSMFIENKLNNKHNIKQILKSYKRHFMPKRTELIQDVIHYFNQKYLHDDDNTSQYEDYVQVSSSTGYSVPATLFHSKFKPTPKLFQYFIKKISKSNSNTKIAPTDSSAGIIMSSTVKTTNRSMNLLVSNEGAGIEGNVTNLQPDETRAVAKLQKNQNESTTVLSKSQLKSTVSTQTGQSTATSALKVFLKFINLFSKDNETSFETTTAKTARPPKPQSLLIKRPLIFSHGYRVALHHIETVDGYMLTVHRILPRQKLRPIAKRRNRIALLHHGLLGSADDWVLLGPQKALPYLLTDIGYDVWLTNARGNKYSYSSSNRRVNVSDYWNFSFHEIGIYDLSAVIDHIRLKTRGNSRIDFIGHSMGATALLVLLSTNPQYNFLLRSAILLAPLAYMYRTQGLLRLLSEYQTKKGYKSLYFLGETEFMPSRAFPGKVTKLYCKGDKLSCLNPWLLIANGGLIMKNKTLEKIILEHVPAGGSTKTIVHYTQLVRSGQFQRFDLGAAINAMRYGTRAPPSYCLNVITIPVVIFSSQDDLLSTTTDTEKLISNLPNFIGHHVVKRDKFTHTDFVWAEDAPDEIYYRIIDLMDHESSRDSLGPLL